MGFNSIPCNPYPISTEELNKGNNDDLNARVSALEGDVSDLDSAKASKTDIATEFSDLTNYNSGDLVYYEGDLYEFQVDHTAGAWETSEVIQKDLSDIVNSLKSGLMNAEDAIITPSSDYTKLGSGAIDSGNPVIVSLGNNNIFDYDMLYFCVSYYDSGVATYGGLTIPTILEHLLYSGDAGVTFFARNAAFDNIVGVGVVLNTNNNTIRFNPSAQPAGGYYVVYGIKWRTSN